MALMKQTVTLEIVYDSFNTPNPVEWNWYDLADFAPDESIEVVKTTTPERVDN